MDNSDLVRVSASGRSGRRITILYFARLKEAFGLGSERLPLPPSVATVGALREFLRTRGGAWEVELGRGQTRARRVEPRDGAAARASSTPGTKSPSFRPSREAEVPVRIQTEDFDAGTEIAALRRGNPAIGAIASFIGLVRDANEGERIRR